jgi:hypothetical protein
VTADRHTTEQAPETRPEAPESASTPEVGISGGSKAGNGAHAGADGLGGEQEPRGPIDWARRQQAEREQQAATDPRQLAYDAVYEYIRNLGDYLPSNPVDRNALIWHAVHAALDAGARP